MRRGCRTDSPFLCPLISLSLALLVKGTTGCAKEVVAALDSANHASNDLRFCGQSHFFYYICSSIKAIHNMKRVYLSVRSLLSAGASLLLGWLGFASCTESGMAEYGTPTVDYEFKVHVTDQAAKPVEGLQVDLPISHENEKEVTDAQGKAELDGSYTGFRRDHKVVLMVTDIDGEKNGVVADQQVTIDVKESDFVSKGSGNWNNGKVKKDIEIQVERK